MAESKRKTVLQVQDLATGYGAGRFKQVISEAMNFELFEGELVALVGPNGSGKSTLLRTLSGMQPALSGTIVINDHDLASVSPLKLATELSLVLTQPPASVNLTVWELVSLGRQPYTNSFGILTSKDRMAVAQAMELTETRPLAGKKCHELSDGQLQRAVIARALAQDTGLIIMDEPTTHLDLYHRAYVLKLLKRLSSENNKTIVFSTHEIDLAIQIANRILILNQNTFYHGNPGDLIKQGCFDTLFPEDSIHFDQQSGRFTIRN